MLNKKFKKAISSVTMFATVISLSGISMLAPLAVSAATVVDGDVIKSNATNSDGTPALSSLDVYIVKIVGNKKFKRLVLNPQVFSSYGHLKWGNIKTVSQAEEDSFKTSDLVRVDGDSKVWALTPAGDTGAKSWVNVTADQFLNGANSDPDSIYTINSVDGGSYTTRTDITTVQQLKDFYKDGTLPGGSVEKGPLDVSLASSTPESASLPGGAQYVPFTTLVLTAGSEDVTVNGLTVKRSGLGSSSDIDKVFVAEDGVIKGSLKSLPTSDEAVLYFTGTEAIKVNAGSSKEVTIYANMNTGTPGDYNALKVTAVESDAASVTGLPVTGNEMVVGSTSAPTTEFEHVSISTSRAVGDEGADVAKVKIINKNSNEDVSVNAITFKSVAPSSGTKIDNSDIANFELFDGNTSVSEVVPALDASGYVVMTLNDPIVIAKGGSKYKTLTLKADVLGGPGRKITMDIYRAIDLNVTGNTNDFRTKNTDSFTASSITIEDSDLTVSLASDSPKAQTILKDQTVTLLKGTLSASKGAVDVTGMRVTLAGNDMDFGTTDEYENLKVYVDDVLVSTATGSEISTSDNQTSINVNFTDEFSVDGSAKVEVTIDVKNVTDSDWIQAIMPSGTGVMPATRESDGTSITSTGTATGNKQTIGAASLRVTLAAVPTSATRVKGSSDVEFLGFNLVTGANDAVKITDLTLALDSSTGTANKADVSNVKIYASNGTTLIAGPKNLDSSKQAVFTGLDIDLAKGTSTKYVVKADINSTIYDTVDPAVTTLNLEFADITAENSQGEDIASIVGGNATGGSLVNASATTNITLVDSGTLNVELSTSTPKTHQVMASTVGDDSTKIKFSAGYEPVVIKKVILTAAAGAGADDEVAKVTLKDGSTEIGSTESIATGVASITIPEDKWVTIPKDGNKTLTIVTDYNSTNNGVADSGAIVQWTINSFASDIEADGAVKDVYGAVASSTGTGVTLTAGEETTYTSGDYTATQTLLTMVSTADFAVGNLLLLDEAGDGSYTAADDEYVLITEINSATTLTVRRGVAGSTAKSIVDDALDIAEFSQKLAGNSSLVYSNFPTISAPTQPSNTLLSVGEKEALKFTVTDKSNGEEPIRLSEVLVRVDGSGMAATSGWVISSASLINDQTGGVVGTDADGIATSGDLSFASLSSDVDSIIDGSTTFTVRVTIALGSTPGTIDAGDTLQLSINNFGSADAAGAITNGDLDWQDDENPGAIQWVDTTLTSIQGQTLRYTTS